MLPEYAVAAPPAGDEDEATCAAFKLRGVPEATLLNCTDAVVEEDNKEGTVIDVIGLLVNNAKSKMPEEFAPVLKLGNPVTLANPVALKADPAAFNSNMSAPPLPLIAKFGFDVKVTVSIPVDPV